MSLDKKLDKILERHIWLQKEMEKPIDDPKIFASLSKEYSDLEEIVGVVQEYKTLVKNIKDSEGLLADKDGDKELRDLAQEELEEMRPQLEEIEEKIKVLLLPKDADDERNAILEIRAGTGGDEAGLFAGDLLRMYQRYADKHGWKFEMMGLNETGIGSVKEASASIVGKGVFAKLKFESGVHRVQRVPETESGGRIHTSTATVAVLPEVEEVDIELNDEDLRIDICRASGAGGQHINTTDSAVRITHIPTGIVVQQQDQRSQHKNKAKALKILRARIYEEEKRRKDAERSAERKSQVGTGERSERIRTYNFPQGRVTDHRINLTLYKIDTILSGEDLDGVIDALIADDQAQKLAHAEVD